MGNGKTKDGGILGMKTKRINVAIPEELHKELIDAKEITGKFVRAMVTEALRDYLKKVKK